MTDVELSSKEAGSPLALSLKMKREEWERMFSLKDWNDIVRFSLLEAGWWWMAKYLPLRFTWYAKFAGIYHGMKRKGMPLVVTGRLYETVMAGSRVEAKATSGNSYIDLIIPMGTALKGRPDGKRPFNYSSNPIVRETLNTVTMTEVEGMNRVFNATLQGFIDHAERKTFGRGPRANAVKSLHVTPAQRETIRASRPPRPPQRPKQRKQ